MSIVSSPKPMSTYLGLGVERWGRDISDIWLYWLLIPSNPEKKAAFGDATSEFPVKWCPSNECGNSILMMCHYPDLGSASDWSCRKRNLLQPIQHYPDLGRSVSIITMDFLQSMPRHYFTGKPVVIVWNVTCLHLNFARIQCWCREWRIPCLPCYKKKRIQQSGLHWKNSRTSMIMESITHLK